MNLNTTSEGSSSGTNDDSLDAFERKLRSLLPRPAQCHAPQQLSQLSPGTQALRAAVGRRDHDDRDDRLRQRGRGAMLLAAWTLGAAAGVVGTLAWTGYWNHTESQTTIVQTNPNNTTRQSNSIDPENEMKEQPLRDVEQSASQTTPSNTDTENQEPIQPKTTSQQRLVALFPWRQLQRTEDGPILTPGSRSMVDALVSPKYFHGSPPPADTTQTRAPNASPPSPSTWVPAVISPRTVDMATPASQHKLRHDLLSDDRKIF